MRLFICSCSTGGDLTVMLVRNPVNAFSTEYESLRSHVRGPDDERVDFGRNMAA